MEWWYAPRQGESNGKQNTQLELGLHHEPVKVVVEKLKQQLEILIRHKTEHRWKAHSLKLDTVMSNSLTTRVFETDFGATLDLDAAKKDNCSVANHAVFCIFFVISNWRKVKFKKGQSNETIEWDEVIISDCDKCIFWGHNVKR